MGKNEGFHPRTRERSITGPQIRGGRAGRKREDRCSDRSWLYRRKGGGGAGGKVSIFFNPKRKKGMGKVWTKKIMRGGEPNPTEESGGRTGGRGPAFS